MKTSFLFQPLIKRALTLAIAAILFCGATARSDVVFAWNELLLHLATHSSEPIPPLIEVRAFAMAHLAMDDAVTAVSRGNPNHVSRVAQRAAAVSAARAVLVQLLPSASTAFDALAERHLLAIPDGDDKARGVEAGRDVASRICERRQNDGWLDVTRFTPGAGLPDSSEAAAVAVARGETLPPSPWLGARPFLLKSAQQFSISEVRTVTRFGQVEPDFFLQHSKLFEKVDQAGAIAAREGFWSAKPVIAWNRIARQIAATFPVDLAGQARVLAMLNVALADTTLASLHWRHTVGGWRSRLADIWETTDGTTSRFSDVLVNVNGGWEPVLARSEIHRVLIPPMPNFPSVDAAVAGAAQAVLTRFFKTDQVAFTLPRSAAHAGDSSAPRTFASISAAARECAFVASLDGRHLREACIAGYSLGTSVGSYIGKRHIALRR